MRYYNVFFKWPARIVGSATSVPDGRVVQGAAGGIVIRAGILHSKILSRGRTTRVPCNRRPFRRGFYSAKGLAIRKTAKAGRIVTAALTPNGRYRFNLSRRVIIIVDQCAHTLETLVTRRIVVIYIV